MPWFRPARQVLILAGVYVVLARLGLMMDAVGGFATLVWPPTGVSIVALLRLGVGLWPGVALGAFVANVWIGAPPLVALGVAAGNTLEAVVGAWGLRRLTGLDGPPQRLRHVVGLVLWAALGSTLISAAIGVASLRLGGVIQGAAIGRTFRAWWLGDAIGAVVVAPLLLSWVTRERWPRGRRLLESMVVCLGVIAVSLLVFSGSMPPESAVAQVYLVFPLLLWAALRFHVRGATAGTLLVSIVAVSCTALGRGPFHRATLSSSLVLLQSFMAIVAVTTLVVAAAIQERDRAVAARESLLAVVSHDLKNPLTALRLQLELLSKRLADDKVVVSLQRATDRMTLLVRDLLDFTTLETGALRLRLETVSASSLVDEVIDNLRATAAMRRQTLDSQVAGEPRVECDRARLLQALLNLVENALKFSPEGATTTIAVATDSKGVRFSVRDTGAGIPADQLAHVFEPFWRGDLTKPGSGLGLSIARRIIEAHHAFLHVESRVGEGSTFGFTLRAV
jgi:signal transduction histidine kinase